MESVDNSVRVRYLFSLVNKVFSILSVIITWEVVLAKSSSIDSESESKTSFRNSAKTPMGLSSSESSLKPPKETKPRFRAHSGS